MNGCWCWMRLGDERGGLYAFLVSIEVPLGMGCVSSVGSLGQMGGISRAILQLGASLRFPIALYQKVLMTQANTIAKPQFGTVLGHCAQHIFMSKGVAPTIYKLPWPIIGRISAQGTLLNSAQACEQWGSDLRITSPKRTPLKLIRSGIKLFFFLINAQKNGPRTRDSVYQ